MNEYKDKQVHKINTKQHKNQPPRKPAFKQYNKGEQTVTSSCENSQIMQILWKALMMVNDCEIRFQLDSGADVNTIKKKYVRKDQVQNCSKTLRMFNKSSLKPQGETTLYLENVKTGEKNEINFVIVPNSSAWTQDNQTSRTNNCKAGPVHCENRI